MKFALTAHTPLGDQVLAWSNDSDIDLVGSEDLVRRAHRLVTLGRTIYRDQPASLATPHLAYHTCLVVLREHGGVTGPIDFAGIDDDGYPMTFMPMPEAQHDVTT